MRLLNKIDFIIVQKDLTLPVQNAFTCSQKPN